MERSKQDHAGRKVKEATFKCRAFRKNGEKKVNGNSESTDERCKKEKNKS